MRKEKQKEQVDRKRYKEYVLKIKNKESQKANSSIPNVSMRKENFIKSNATSQKKIKKNFYYLFESSNSTEPCDDEYIEKLFQSIIMEVEGYIVRERKVFRAVSNNGHSCSSDYLNFQIRNISLMMYLLSKECSSSEEEN